MVWEGISYSYLKSSNWLQLTFYNINDIKLPNHAYVMRSVEMMIMGRLQLAKVGPYFHFIYLQIAARVQYDECCAGRWKKLVSLNTADIINVKNVVAAFHT